MRGATVQELARRLAGRAAAGSERSFAHLTDVQVAAGTPFRSDRVATIYAPARSAMTSGLAQTVDSGAAEWRVAFRVERKWINPLIGWTSTADTEETMSRALYFESKEAAVAHAEKAGWEYEVIEHAPAVRGVEGRPKRFVGYGDNYSFKRGGVPTGGLRSEQAAAAAPAAAAAAGGKKKKAAA